MLLVAALGLAACASAPPSPRGGGAPEPAPAGQLSPGSSHHFVLRTPAATEAGRFNYEFVRFTVGDARAVSGVQVSQPWGTDGMAGAFRGVHDPEAGLIRTRLDYLAEGTRYQESRDFALTAQGLGLGYRGADGAPVIGPRRTGDEYRALYDAFQRQQLAGALNTTDRSRLLRVAPLREVYPEDELREVRFYERYVDLDHDPATGEYLLYVVDSMVCGSGGCTLFVIDEDGRVLSETTVVKLPVYTTRTSFEEAQARRGQWRHLYARSDGMRRLEAPAGRYPANASLQPRVLEAQLLDLPDHYRLVMDHPR